MDTFEKHDKEFLGVNTDIFWDTPHKTLPVANVDTVLGTHGTSLGDALKLSEMTG